MTDPTAPLGSTASSVPSDEEAIRERVRELTSQMLASGRLDTESLTQVVRALSGNAHKAPLEDLQAREAFALPIARLTEALRASAQVTNDALQALASRGKDFSDNDLKQVYAALENLQQDYVAVAKHIAEGTTGNLRRELADLALHAQRVGADAGVRMAQLVSEFTNRVTDTYRGSAAPAFGSVRQAGANVSMLTSGLLAGFADALRQHSQTGK